MLPTNFITQVVEKAYTAFSGVYLHTSKIHFAKLQPYIDRFIVSLDKENDSLLDIGCGPGLLLEYLSKLGYKKLLGTELSEAVLKEAATRVPSHMLLRQDFHQLNFQRKEFNAVVAINTLLYTNKQTLPSILDRINHCMADGGQLLIILPEGVGERLTEEVYTSPETKLQTQHAVYHSYYQAEEIKSLLAEAEFNVVSLDKLTDLAFEHTLLIVTARKT
ncbi:class I SAM-dependent methyltransferase [Patescibacteria group bacterium]|nr:class I SAM-dependent methyltransferase [Patescibacteria group bacterium]